MIILAATSLFSTDNNVICIIFYNSIVSSEIHKRHSQFRGLSNLLRHNYTLFEYTIVIPILFVYLISVMQYIFRVLLPNKAYVS